MQFLSEPLHFFSYSFVRDVLSWMEQEILNINSKCVNVWSFNYDTWHITKFLELVQRENCVSLFLKAIQFYPKWTHEIFRDKKRKWLIFKPQNLNIICTLPLYNKQSIQAKHSFGNISLKRVTWLGVPWNPVLRTVTMVM